MKNFFKNKDDQTVITQKPNAPIVAWFIFLLIGLLPLSQELSDLVDFLGFSAIFIWASLEILDGNSPFRKLLGVVVMVFIIYGVT